MTKIVVVEHCSTCSHRGHTGAFTKGGAKPLCGHPETVKSRGHDHKNRVIPYKTVQGGICGPVRVSKRIPDWCPLEDRIPKAAVCDCEDPIVQATVHPLPDICICCRKAVIE